MRTGGLAALLGLLALPVHASWPSRGEVVLADDPRVRIAAELVYDDVPTSGFVPIQIRIDNREPETREYELQLRTSSIAQIWATPRYVYTTSITAPAEQLTEVELVVPVAGGSHETESYLSVRVRGPGLDARQHLHSHYGGQDVYTWVGTSERVWGSLRESFREDLERGDASARGTSLALPLEPSSVRALHGFDALWLFDEDVTAMSAVARRAVADWVLRGGRLTVIRREGLRSLEDTLGLRGGVTGPGLAPDEVIYGFGRLRLVRIASSVDPLPDEVLSQGLPAPWVRLDPDSPLVENIPGIRLARGAIALVVLAFFLIAGPFNLWYLARGRRAGVLPISTPAISLAFSLLLGGVILLQEGVGGSGTRYVAHLILPEMQREVVVQEQVARTGVLLSSDFALNPDVYLDRYQVQDDLFASWRFARGPSGLSGDWFRTRAVQAHVVEHVRASRARVERIPEAGAREPVLLSSLPVALETLYYVDPSGGVWQGSDVGPGEQARLVRVADPAGLRAELPEPLDGGLLSRLLGEPPRRGYFYALAAEPSEAMIETLATLDWDDPLALYLGPVQEASR